MVEETKDNSSEMTKISNSSYPSLNRDNKELNVVFLYPKLDDSVDIIDI